MKRTLVPNLTKFPPNRLVIGSPNVLRDAAVFRAWIDYFRKKYNKVVAAGIRPEHDINVHLAPWFLAINHDWLCFSKAVVESGFFKEYLPEAREFTLMLYTLATTFWEAYYRVHEQVPSRHVHSNSSSYAFLDNRTQSLIEAWFREAGLDYAHMHRLFNAHSYDQLDGMVHFDPSTVVSRAHVRPKRYWMIFIAGLAHFLCETSESKGLSLFRKRYQDHWPARFLIGPQAQSIWGADDIRGPVTLGGYFASHVETNCTYASGSLERDYHIVRCIFWMINHVVDKLGMGDAQAEQAISAFVGTLVVPKVTA
ncbi:uncharacterized protein SCHCODRAFT_02567793 [Schizophyllum commune H4-8]|nr:uncharacterized protein SCHCODRAFT_02567793 [Schizophyllum commune H4-8]KAI5898846.1 hypothetical protein SCHCODRAFT_02567793 [Schizophyllum commune H4-8]